MRKFWNTLYVGYLLRAIEIPRHRYITWPAWIFIVEVRIAKLEFFEPPLHIHSLAASSPKAPTIFWVEKFELVEQNTPKITIIHIWLINENRVKKITKIINNDFIEQKNYVRTKIRHFCCILFLSVVVMIQISASYRDNT